MPSTRLTRYDLLVGARLIAGLAAFLRRPVSTAEAHATLRRRLADRNADFLALLDQAVFRHPTSPYLALLRAAGCERGDLRRLLESEGLEGALQELFRRGVYLTVDEFKGRRPIRRGSLQLDLSPASLRNPFSAPQLVVQSGGSRGVRGVTPIDLASLRDRSVNLRLFLEVRSGLDWQHAVWEVPGGAALAHLLRFSGAGACPVHWFSQVDPATPGLHPRYRWSARAVRWGSALALRPLPPSIHAPLDDPRPVLDWLTALRSRGRQGHIYTFPSSVLRLAQAARDRGTDLQGTHFTVTGEPYTAARRQLLQNAGADVVSRYGSSEASVVADGCLAPDQPDDSHLLHDYSALIQPGPDGRAGLPPSALLITALRATTPLILINVSLGDRAELSRRACGCPFERLGWTTHLHTIRSFEKLTAGGMTFLDADVARLLEVELPARLGGAPADYQLCELETDSGQPRLQLLIDPRVGPLDPIVAVQLLLQQLGATSGPERVMALQWRQQPDLIEVVRRAPLSTPSGKVLHLHRAAAAPVGAG